MPALKDPQVKLPVFGKVGLVSLSIAVLVTFLIFRYLGRQAGIRIPISPPTPPPPPPPPSGPSTGIPTQPAPVSKYQAAMNPTFWRQYSTSSRLISQAQARELAEMIRNAKGIINDDEDAVAAAIMTAGSVINVSRVADEFRKAYNSSMNRYLVSFLNQREMERYVISPIESLPWI